MGRQNVKLIALDEITCKFLAVLRSERIRRKLTLKHVAEYCGCSYSRIGECERGKMYPSLESLMRLSELYEYDLSESVNYKYYHGKIRYSEARREMKRYKLTYDELSDLTRFSRLSVYRALNADRGVSVECLRRVLEVLEHEKECERIRLKLCRKR